MNEPLFQSKLAKIVNEEYLNERNKEAKSIELTAKQIGSVTELQKHSAGKSTKKGKKTND